MPRMPCRSFVSSCLALISAAVVIALAPAAHATITINQNLIQHTKPTHTDAVTRLYISRSDCAGDDALQFSLSLQDFAGVGGLQVWVTDASADCSLDTARNSDSATCWKVYDNANLTVTYPATIRVQDMVKGRAAMGRAGTSADCDAPAIGSGSALQQITFYFMLVNGNTLVGSATNWSTKIDLNGPSAPTGLSLGKGGTLLKVGWNPALTDPDVAGYRVYCDSRTIFEGITDPAGDAGSGATPDGSNSTTCSSDAGADAADGADDADAEGDSAAQGCDGSSASSADSSGSDNGSSVCKSSLPAGKIPTSALSALVCATSAGNQSGSATVTGLTNGQVYNVAVAAYDLVGNSGPLTSVVCDAPEPVYGFAEAYGQNGGAAGGGFCSLARLGQAHATRYTGLLGLFGLTAGAALLRRRRRLPA
jgi:hypothetical protein